jgi:hypothetical protein
MRQMTSGNGLHRHGRAVSRYFGNALHHFRGVVTRTNHGVGAMLGSVLQKKLEGLPPQIVCSAPQKIADEAARPHHDSANNPDIPHHPIPRQMHSASNHSRIGSGLCFSLKKWNGS